jgi:hypothetical protein
MRKLPKALAKFQKIVDERGERLRGTSIEDLKQLTNQSDEQITVGSRPATISVLVQPKPDGSVRVVLQGFMKALFLPGKHVAINGFYKHPDGTVTPMSSSELYDYD